MFHSLPRVGSVRCTQCHRAHRDCVGVLEDNQLPMPARHQNVLLAPATKSGRIQPGPAHACACQSGIGESDRPRGSHLVHDTGPFCSLLFYLLYRILNFIPNLHQTST